ncbi:MAG: membrane protein insertase YidC, partial [Burkholderiales bacterium]|nr:membrane protein insertase YidC [Burkholderiales bacterium]
MDTQRLIALIVFTFSGLMLWEAWNKHNRPPVPPAPVAQTQANTPSPSGATEKSVPMAAGTSSTVALGVPLATTDSPSSAVPGVSAAKTAKRVLVKTDLLSVELDTHGGDIRTVTLLKHPAHGDAKHPFNLLQDKVGAYFVAQSGLLGQG